MASAEEKIAEWGEIWEGSPSPSRLGSPVSVVIPCWKRILVYFKGTERSFSHKHVYADGLSSSNSVSCHGAKLTVGWGNCPMPQRRTGPADIRTRIDYSDAFIVSK